MALRVRALSEEEAHKLARMTRSQKLGAGLVRRARIIQHAVDGLSAPGSAAKMGLCGATVRFWLKRFNERGLGGLEGDMRSGRPPTYTAEERSAVIAAALSRPAELGLPFASWTLDRLVARQGRLATLRRHLDPLTDKPAVYTHCFGRFDPRLARSYHFHRDTAQLCLRRRGQLAKISFDCHAGHKQRNPAGVTYLRA